MNKYESFPRGWTLIDAAKRAKESPKTFHLPKLPSIINRGRMVKIGLDSGLTYGPTGERFWVEVIGAKGSDYLGKVANELVVVNWLEEGDTISFRRNNILDIE